MKTTLVIMAAGMWSRYGWLKQIDGFGPNGETIMEYSIYDAIRAWFTNVVIVIRKSFEEQFKEVLGSRFDDKITVEYAFQEINPKIDGFDNLPERTKPWWTGHAVLAVKDHIQWNFCVINADDYYGVDGYGQMLDWLSNNCKEKKACIIGYVLKNTLSKNGTVNRGICEVDENNNLVAISDRLKIWKISDTVAAKPDGEEVSLDSVVSMTMLWFHASFLDRLEQYFKNFLSDPENWKKEFFITTHGIDVYINEPWNSCGVRISKDQWHWVTYAQDKETTKVAIQNLVDTGVYPSPLWS